MVQLNWRFGNIFCFICFILQLKYTQTLRAKEDVLEDILRPYKSYREHLNLNRNHRHVRDCQPIHYGNTTFETFSKKDINESIEAECKDTEETGTLQEFANVMSGRTAVGHDKSGRVIIVQVDGKTNHRG